MKKTTKTLLTLLLALVLVLVLAGAASAEETVSVPFVDASGKAQSPRTCTVVQSGNEHKTLGEGWYVVQGEVSFSEGMILWGNVNLILADGCVLNAGDGIWVQDNVNLSIWAQSLGENMGMLVATGGDGKAGIGGIEDHNCGGTITINGGRITATGGSGGDGSASPSPSVTAVSCSSWTRGSSAPRTLSCPKI